MKSRAAAEGPPECATRAALHFTSWRGALAVFDADLKTRDARQLASLRGFFVYRSMHQRCAAASQMADPHVISPRQLSFSSDKSVVLEDIE